MKVIDLLNKIANKEEIPKKIMFEDKWYEWNVFMNDYEYEEKHLFLVEGLEVEDLNEEVELKKENKKIEKLRLSSHWGGTFEEEQKYRNNRDGEISKKIDEIIDEINKLKEGK